MKRLLLIITFTLITMSISKQSVIKDNKFCVPFQEENCEPSQKVTGTVYWPVEGQTDNTPLITADGSKIDPNKLKQGKVKWIALSRDMLKRWGGSYDYGEKVKITSNNPEINGIYEIHDTMNARYTNRIDFLSHEDGVYGKWENIHINKVT